MPNIKNDSQPLTARQLQVVALVGQGLSNKEIANELKISEGTVKQHIFAVFRLLNVPSRAKLAIHSQRFALAHKEKPRNALNGVDFNLGYSWRLIVAVAMSIPAIEELDLVSIIERKSYLDQLHLSIDELVIALDANSMLLPDGGLLIWFGYPTSHIDDVDRAAFLAQSIRVLLDSNKSKKLQIGLGIATQAEIVPAETKQLIAAHAFQKALNLANKSSQLTLSLANDLTERLCSASVPWIALRPTSASANKKEENKKLEESIYAIGNQQSSPIRPSQWGNLSFLTPVFQLVKTGIAQWLCVESWPPSLANSLVDAIGVEAKKEGFLPLKLHIPSAKRREVILSSLLTQLEIVAADCDLTSHHPDSIQDRFLSSLSRLSARDPIALQVIGIQSLQALKSALGDRGVDRLVGLRVLVVVIDLRDAQKPQTSIRTLGPRPDNSVFTRVHVMEEPEIDLVPEGVLVDIQAMVDDLSPPARQLIFAAAQSQGMAINELLALVNLPRPVLQGGLQELVSLGLLLPRDDHYFYFRDPLTASAVLQLNKQVTSN